MRVSMQQLEGSQDMPPWFHLHMHIPKSKKNLITLSSPQLPSLALMEQFVWLMDRLQVQAEWRSASMECGEEFVVVPGIVVLPRLCVDNWGTVSTQVKVS